MLTIKVRYSREYGCWYYHAGKRKASYAIAAENAADLKADAVKAARRWARYMSVRGRSVRVAVYTKTGRLQSEYFYEG